MFDWVGDALDWMSSAVASAWTGAVDTVNENPVETETESTFVEPAVAFNNDAYHRYPYNQEHSYYR